MDINYDLQLQLVEYLNNNFNLAWFKLFQLNKDLYPVYLYNLRKNRYILTANEVKLLNIYINKLPDFIDYELYEAVKNGYLQVVKYLVSCGADIDAEIGDKSILEWAAHKGHLHVVKYLVEQGADVHANIDAALAIAAGKGYLPIVKYLVSQEANINFEIYSPFRCAAHEGHLKVVKYLVEHGQKTRGVSNLNPLDLSANTNVVHGNDNQALRWAAMNGHLNVLKYLVEKGADIHAFNDYALKWSAEYEHLDVVKYLVEQGANVDVLTAYQRQKYEI